MKTKKTTRKIKLAGQPRAIVDGGTLHQLVAATGRISELERENLELTTWLANQRDLKRAAREKLHRQAELALEVIFAQASEIQRLELLLHDEQERLYDKCSGYIKKLDATEREDDRLLAEQREKILTLERTASLAIRDADEANRRYEALRGLTKLSQTLLAAELAQTRAVSFTWRGAPAVVLRVWSRWLKPKDLAATENS